MASWSAEHATRAYLQTLNMGKRGKEPNVAELIAALAAGNNAKLMVMVCAGNAGSTALALGAAAQETGGRTVCILSGLELHASRKALGCHADFIELVVRNAQSLNEYHGADFVLVDCKLEEYKAVLLTAQRCLKKAFLVGYNAIHGEPWNIDSLKPHFLPIGEGLLVTRISSSSAATDDKFRGVGKRGVGW